MKKQLTERQQHELDKYKDVFKRGTTRVKGSGVYGDANWGLRIYDYIKDIKPKSILDIGCGMGVFVNDMDKNLQIPKVYGLDIASIKTGNYHANDNITWIDSMAHDIPLEDNTVEYITSFDALEHCLPEDIDQIVDEFYRVVTKGLILKITYQQASERSLDNEFLHMTVQPESWWVEKFMKKFIYKGNRNGYLLFSKT